jgi:Skp family chaperone for outer membrane proteins
MADEKKEPWLNYLALTAVILAVCATLATFKGGGYSTRSVLSQAQASDQWAYYQAKSVKSNLYEIQRDQILRDAEDAAPARAEKLRKAADDYTRKMAKYDAEKEQISAEAKRLETVKTEAQKHSAAFGIAVIFLQIAILLSSISALLKKPPVWMLGVAVGIVGILYFLSGFFLFLPA